MYHLKADETRLEKLFTEPKSAICAISCHPYQPLVAIGSFCGMIKVWDYEKKKYLFSRVFEKGRGVQSLTYNPEGIFISARAPHGNRPQWPRPRSSLPLEVPLESTPPPGSMTHLLPLAPAAR